MNDPGADKPRRLPGDPGPLDAPIGRWPMPIADRGGGMVGMSVLTSRLRGFGRRGGTRRLKFATTSGGEWRFRVGWAGMNGTISSSQAVELLGDMLTPCACVGVVDGGVDVAKVYFAHEAVYLG